MRSGNKNKRIRIEQQTLSSDGYGEKIATWSLYKTVWAEVREPKGREFFENGYVSQLDLVFRIDYIKDLSPKTHRIVYDSDIYDIYSITERGRREVTEITAKAQGV